MFQKFNKLKAMFVAVLVLIYGCGFAMAESESAVPVPVKKPVAQSITASSLDSLVGEVVPVPANKPPLDIPVNNTVVVSKDTLIVSKNFPDKQVRLYREIFTLQDKGNIVAADQKIKQLKTDMLIGHVLAERYLHPTAYRARFDELQNWMEHYADHPQANRIYKLALMKRPKSSISLVLPKQKKDIHGNFGAVSKRGQNYRVTKSRSQNEENKVAAFKRDIKKQIKKNQPTMALNILNTDYTVKFIDDVEYDRLRAEIAAGYLFANKLDQALKLSDESYTRSRSKAPLAGWVKGLVQWQNRQYHSAAKAFESAARSPYSSGWMVSAAGYWASRAHMRSGNVSQVSQWLDLASTYPRTFYGLIATRALGHKTEFDWSVPSLTRNHVKIIEKSVHGRRATALVKAKQIHLAEEELRNIHAKGSLEMRNALIAYASYYKLPSLSMQLGNAMKNKKGGLYDAALYPDTSWSPLSGYKIDRALIHAIVRQESRFRTHAQNPSGATGLMQLMPTTANHVSGKDIYHQVSGQYELKDPAVNLDLGQKYIRELLNHRAVGQDLLSLAIAYNAGPGNLSKWKRERTHIKDPLLFIETIPYHETRAFVERVLSNYWIYRMRFKQDTPSLDAVAEGKWARYAAQDIRDSKMALAH